MVQIRLGKSADRTLELKSPATLKYAGLNFTVTHAVISDEGQANSNEANSRYFRRESIGDRCAYFRRDMGIKDRRR